MSKWSENLAFYYIFEHMKQNIATECRDPWPEEVLDSRSNDI